MKNDGTPVSAILPISEEGLPYLSVFALASLSFLFAGWWQAALVFIFISLSLLIFFRNPERLAPVGKGVVCSPADGRVTYVGPSFEGDFLGQEMLKVSVFISLLDVHVNRAPADGTVRGVKHHRGRYISGAEQRASEENERNAVLIEDPEGRQMVVVQVAGVMTRRIACYFKDGDYVSRGQRLGCIVFGCRVDLYLPMGSEVFVEVGEHVFGGETMLARVQTTASL